MNRVCLGYMLMVSTTKYKDYERKKYDKKHIFSRSVEIQIFFYKACNTAFSFLSEFYLQFLGSGSEIVTNLYTVISGSALGLN